MIKIKKNKPKNVKCTLAGARGLPENQFAAGIGRFGAGG
jgi:hypothetical protein